MNDSTGFEHPIRVLHIVDRMTAGGGVQNWLMQVLQKIDRERFQLDFQAMEAHVFDKEIKALGSNLFLYPSHRDIRGYAQHLRHVLLKSGPYDVIHCHAQYFSGYALRVATHAGVPIRIAHSHNGIPLHPSLARRFFQRLMVCLIDRYATTGLAASRDAALALFGKNWHRDPRWQVFYCGVDFSHFCQPVDPRSVRDELNIPEDALVIGHVGRFIEEKNHTFLLDVAAEVAQREPNLRLLLIGEGPLQSAMRQKATELGLAEKVIFTGTRMDVPRLMIGAMDVFVLPSFVEGFGLVGIEAQAAGIPVLLATGVIDEIDAIPSLIHRIDLAQPASAWAEIVLRVAKADSYRLAYMKQLEESEFSLEKRVRSLERLYCTLRHRS